MSRQSERAELKALIESKMPFAGHQEVTRLVTVLLDGGFRNNRIVLEEFADFFEETGAAVGIQPDVVEHVPNIARRYARDLEDKWKR